jgi:hypothetical protein
MNSFIESGATSPDTIFDKKIELMRASEFCSKFGYSMKTVYDWKYRPKKNRVPADLVVKFRGKLFIRTGRLKALISSGFLSLDGE